MPTAELPDEVKPHASDATRKLGRYILVKKIGKGGMSEVWRAWDTVLARPIAVKILKDADEEDVTRFRREANILASLHHPNIAPVFGMEQEGNRAYIAMQLVDGETVDRLVAPLAKKVEHVRDAARALHFAHKQGIVHRDVKPSNIMATSDGHLYLLDFGIARPVRKGATITGTDFLVGTPAYMSPEQARGGRCDERTDVYALGATLYRLATHSDPFYGDDPMQVLLKVAQEAPPLPRTLEPSIPRPVEDIIRVAMAKEPAARHQTAEEFAAQLDLFLAGKKVRAAPRDPVKIPQQLWIGLLAAVTVAAVLVAIFKGGPKNGIPSPPVAGPNQPAPPPDTSQVKLENVDMLLETLQRAPAGPDRDKNAAATRATLDDILAAQPHHAGALLRAARLEALLGNSEAALDSADKAVQEAPESAAAVLQRARIRFKRALSLKTHHLSTVELAGGDAASFQAFLEDAARDTPDTALLFKGADEDVKTFRKLSPAAQDADAAFAKGLSAFNAGRFRDAVASLTVAEKSPWLGADARLLLGIALYMTDAFEKGEQALAEAGTGNDVVEARLLLAMLLTVELLGRTDDAGAAFIAEQIKKDFAQLRKIRTVAEIQKVLPGMSGVWRKSFANWLR